MFFGKLLPRDGRFFEMFNEHGAQIAEGARAFMQLVQNYADPGLREKYAAAVGGAERSADKVTAEVHRALHKTFITPLDREQIHSLINAMDNIRDLLQDSSEVMSLYNLQHRSEDEVRLTEISVRCCECVQHVVTLLFGFMNGFHDAANSIATVVFAAFFNVLAILIFHLGVAATIGKGIVEPGVVDQRVVFGAVIGAIA